MASRRRTINKVNLQMYGYPKPGMQRGPFIWLWRLGKTCIIAGLVIYLATPDFGAWALLLGAMAWIVVAAIWLK